MHKIIMLDDIKNVVTPEPECEAIIISSSWSDKYMTHYLTYFQRNHQLCLNELDKIGKKYEYAFLTTMSDYNKYKDQFIIPDITFIITDLDNCVRYENYSGGSHHNKRILGSMHMEYCYYRNKPMISMGGDCYHTINLLPTILNKYSHCHVVGIASQRSYINIVNDVAAREKEIGYDAVLQPRELLKLSLPWLYGTDVRYLMDDYKATTCYNGFFFPVRDSNGKLIGELMRAFHWGPIYIKHPKLGMEQHNDTNWGLDSNPFLAELTTPENVGLITDSDNGFIIDVVMQNAGWDVSSEPRETDPQKYYGYYSHFCGGRGISLVNESLMGRNLAMHTLPLDESWIKLADHVNEFITNTYGGKIKNFPLEWEMLP